MNNQNHQFRNLIHYHPATIELNYNVRLVNIVFLVSRTILQFVKYIQWMALVEAMIMKLVPVPVESNDFCVKWKFERDDHLSFVSDEEYYLKRFQLSSANQIGIRIKARVFISLNPFIHVAHVFSPRPIRRICLKVFCSKWSHVKIIQERFQIHVTHWLPLPINFMCFTDI